MTRQTSAILTIAGSDPSGGAGIQADLKTLTVLGVYGCAAITSLTVQNTLGVHSCQPLEPELVYRQVAAVLADLSVTHVKIGMIGSTAVAFAIIRALDGFPGEIVYDPVLSSSVGQPVRAIDTMDGVRRLAGLATCLTPNLHELRLISGTPCADTDQALQAGRGLLAAYPKLRAVAIKGGHLHEEQAEVTDYLLTADHPQPLARRHPRLVSANTHGTGCTFASALAAYHQRTADYRQAFNLAVDFLDHLLTISADWRLGSGNGGLSHHLFPGTP